MATFVIVNRAPKHSTPSAGGQEHGVLWISGDTALYDGVRQVAERLTVDIAVLHLGAVRFGITGPVRYTMTARETRRPLPPAPARNRPPRPR